MKNTAQIIFSRHNKLTDQIDFLNSAITRKIMIDGKVIHILHGENPPILIKIQKLVLFNHSGLQLQVTVS